MRIKDKAGAVASAVAVKFFRKRIPLAVRWQLTNKCVLQCRYCTIWNTQKKELDLKEIISVLDQLAALGTQTISFSGGEPMLRKEIFEILAETKKRGISTEMNSTGASIPDKIGKLKDLDFLKISLDGPEEIHDAVRGMGSFKMARRAAEAAHAQGLNFIFTTTLTKYNINYIDFIVSLARQLGTFVAFQPIKNLYRGVQDVTELLPQKDDFKGAIKALVALKKKKSSCLRNSLTGLSHISGWPLYPALKCWAGKIFCIIDTDGTVLPCDRINYHGALPNCLKQSFHECLQALPDVNCSGCGFCGVLELNLLMALRWGSLGSILNVIK